jgi:hypothetical protein
MKNTLFAANCLLALVFSQFLIGCASEYKGYTGPSLPTEQTATLKVPWRNGGAGTMGNRYLWVASIDGNKRVGIGGSGTVVKLPSGKHVIGFMYLEQGFGLAQTPYLKEITVEAGKTYLATLHITSSSEIHFVATPIVGIGTQGNSPLTGTVEVSEVADTK